MNSRLFDRQANDKSGVSWPGFQVYSAVMLLHDFNGRIQSEAGAVAYTLCRKEGIEDPGLNFRWDARPVIPYFHDNRIELTADLDSQFAASIHRIDSVVDQVGPHLIQCAAVSADTRQL